MNCKPGDLAFIVRCGIPENLGRIVRVLRSAGVFTFRDGTTAVSWTVMADGAPLHALQDSNWARIFAHEVIVADFTLRPIRPEPELLPAPPVAVTV